MFRFQIIRATIYAPGKMYMLDGTGLLTVHDATSLAIGALARKQRILHTQRISERLDS